MAIDPNNINTIRVGELPPADFNLTDIIPHEVGADLKSGTIQQFVDFIAPLLSAIQFEVKVLHVNQAYIDDNFDGTGLGTNLMTGYAICNGNNGTINKSGKVGVAYGGTFNVIGATGGSATHTLTIDEMPSHSHDVEDTDVVAENSAPGSGRPNTQIVGTTQTSAVGGGQPHNNMQPYLVELHVMKL